MLQAGDRIRIQGRRGVVTGTIAHLTSPRMLATQKLPPDLHMLTPAIIQILEEWRILKIAVCSYRRDDNARVAFIALLDACGTWRDLQQQVLTITPEP